MNTFASSIHAEDGTCAPRKDAIQEAMANGGSKPHRPDETRQVVCARVCVCVCVCVFDTVCFGEASKSAQ